VLLSAAATVAIAACGGSGRSSPVYTGFAAKPAKQILTAAMNALGSAHTVHIDGSGSNYGTELGYHYWIVNGKGGAGTMSSDSDPFQVVIVGGRYYQNASVSFVDATGAFPDSLAGKWFYTSASDPRISSFAQLMSIKYFVQQLTSRPLQLSKGGTKTIGGQPVVAIHLGRIGSILYVATTGRPYPVELARPGTRANDDQVTDQLFFSRYNKPASLKPPANAISPSQADSGILGATP